MKSQNFAEIGKAKCIGFQRFGHIHISNIDVLLALLVYRFGPADKQNKLRIVSSLTELQWSRRGFVIVYIENSNDCSSTEILYDCSDYSTWLQLLDVLGLISHLANYLVRKM